MRSISVVSKTLFLGLVLFCWSLPTFADVIGPGGNGTTLPAPGGGVTPPTTGGGGTSSGTIIPPFGFPGGGYTSGSGWNWGQNNFTLCSGGNCVWGGQGNAGASSGMGMGGFAGGYNHPQIGFTGCRVLGLVEGNFGGLVMIVSGLVGIVAGALGAYKTALSTLSIGAGAWILRPIVQLFFPFFGC